LLLSLGAKHALGVILNVRNGTADFTEIGLHYIKLVKTREGGLGVRISEFATGGHVGQRKGDKIRTRTDEVVIYTTLDPADQTKNVEADTDQDLPKEESTAESTSEREVSGRLTLQKNLKAKASTESEVGGRPSSARPEVREAMPADAVK
jgi:hypothetical protein